MLYKLRYILWVAALLEACDVIQDGPHVGRHLGFYRKSDIVRKRYKFEFFYAGHVEYDIIKHLLIFVYIVWHFLPKKGKNTCISLQKWLDHLLLMTSNLVFMVTDSHHTYFKMCLKNMPTSTINGRSR